MYLKSFLYSSSLLVLLALPVAAAEPLAPRGEISVKGGTDRSLLTTEFWAPLAQQSDRVLYGDIRLMGDNDENREGNLGLGYRQIKNDAVVGVHGWIDRRRTQHNSTFHQLTFGVERLGHIVDARANIYIPLNQGRNIITPNTGSSTPYLAGSGIYYDTNGSISETPQYGIDGELGTRIPVWKKQIDAIRVYGGGYYFFRDNTVEVPGARFRTEAQINKAFSVGARVQYDRPRGSQGFLEATLKFPFSAKRLYQESGIRSRLDESPERDVDIVTDAKVVDTGLKKPLLNTTNGAQQRILYVDNSKTTNGDGSYEKPFNTLKSAEAALQANDIVYINRGDGTTHNMDQGITINKSNVQLIGSGSVLTYGGYTLLNAGAAPVITNNQALGDGIYFNNVNAYISGLTVSGAARDGIRVIIDRVAVDAVTITNVTSTGNASRGIFVLANNGGAVGTVTATHNTVANSYGAVSGDFLTGLRGRGIELSAFNNSKFNTVIADYNTASGNSIEGLVVQAQSGSYIDNAYVRNNTTPGNGSNGITLQATALATVNNFYVSNNTSNNNGQSGLIVTNTTNGTLNNVEVSHITANNSAGIGMDISIGGLLKNIALSNITTNSNGSYGISLHPNAGGVINNATLSSIVANNNVQTGVYINSRLAGGGTMDSVTLSRVTANNNLQSGVYLSLNNGGKINAADLSYVTANNNGQHGLQVRSELVGDVVNNVKVAHSTFTGNTLNGVLLAKISTVFLVDLGGGAAGSVGQNTIQNNTGTEVRIDGGYALSARTNYWGGADLSGGERTLNGGSTIDTTGFLMANPNP